MISIRKAELKDVTSITEIYNESVLNGVATLDTVERSEEAAIHWFRNREDWHCVFVAEKNGAIAGYAALSPWSDKLGYSTMAEVSLYILPEFRGMGIGKRLIEILVAEAETGPLHSLLARITEGNDTSLYLHRNMGFRTVGVLEEAGFKFGKFLDVTFMQRVLSKGKNSASE